MDNLKLNTMSKIEQTVCDKIQFRAEAGERKYGTTMERDDLKPSDWLLHLQSELMDAAVYTEKLLQQPQYKIDHFLGLFFVIPTHLFSQYNYEKEKRKYAAEINEFEEFEDKWRQYSKCNISDLNFVIL